MLRVDAKESQSGRHVFRKRKADGRMFESKEGLSKKQGASKDERVPGRDTTAARKTDEKPMKKSLLSFDDEGGR